MIVRVGSTASPTELIMVPECAVQLAAEFSLFDTDWLFSETVVHSKESLLPGALLINLLRNGT